MATPFWHDDPVAWDSLYIAAEKRPQLLAPGVVSSVKVSRGVKLDEKNAPGTNGATLTFQGRKLAKVEIGLTLWTREHLQALDALIAELMPGAPKTPPKPRDFVNPRLQMHGLKSLFVEEIEGPEGPDEKGIVKLTLKCLEFAPPPKSAKSATKTPTASATSVPTVYSTQVFTNGSPELTPEEQIRPPRLPPSAGKPSP